MQLLYRGLFSLLDLFTPLKQLKITFHVSETRSSSKKRTTNIVLLLTINTSNLNIDMAYSLSLAS